MLRLIIILTIWELGSKLLCGYATFKDKHI
jgi:hypothetical protein